MIVTDAHVADLYLSRVSASLAAEGVSASSLVLPAGEGTKSWEGLARLTEWLIGEGIERSDHVIALGGGVIGDLVGFACSIVKRGCAFVQVPTTLLAQRSEEHTSELQSLMRSSYAVFCLKKKKNLK